MRDRENGVGQLVKVVFLLLDYHAQSAIFSLNWRRVWFGCRLGWRRAY